LFYDISNKVTPKNNIFNQLITKDFLFYQKIKKQAQKQKVQAMLGPFIDNVIIY